MTYPRILPPPTPNRAFWSRVSVLLVSAQPSHSRRLCVTPRDLDWPGLLEINAPPCLGLTGLAGRGGAEGGADWAGRLIEPMLAGLLAEVVVPAVAAHRLAMGRPLVEDVGGGDGVREEESVGVHDHGGWVAVEPAGSGGGGDDEGLVVHGGAGGAAECDRLNGLEGGRFRLAQAAKLLACTPPPPLPSTANTETAASRSHRLLLAGSCHPAIANCLQLLPRGRGGRGGGGGGGGEAAADERGWGGRSFRQADDSVRECWECRPKHTAAVNGARSTTEDDAAHRPVRAPSVLCVVCSCGNCEDSCGCA